MTTETYRYTSPVLATAPRRRARLAAGGYAELFAALLALLGGLVLISVLGLSGPAKPAHEPMTWRFVPANSAESQRHTDELLRGQRAWNAWMAEHEEEVQWATN